MTAIKRIGFIGLGNMGTPMAANLVRAGYEVTAYDIAANRAASFAQAPGGRAASARQRLRPGHHHAAERP